MRVLRSQPGNADAHSLLGDIYRDQGAIDDAIQWYRMAVGPAARTARTPRSCGSWRRERERRAAQSGS